MSYVKKFFDMGGTLTVGSDAGSLYALYGATTIRELELMQEAGIHPIDVIQIATRNPWKVLNRPDLEGIRIGNVADVIVVDGNPLDNFKVLYGIGISTFDAAGKPVKKGGVRWTIKAGAVFDAPALLRDVEAQVQKARGNAKTTN
jgi:imidazolonepropionase-like amidohydrolase